MIRAEKGESDKRDADGEQPGLYYPLGYVFDTWLEHRDHGLYPQTGGYDDQDWRLMRDWRTVDKRMTAHVNGEVVGGGDIMGNLDNWAKKNTPSVSSDLRSMID